MDFLYETLEVYPTTDCQLYCSGCYLRKEVKEWSFEDTAKIIKSGIFKKVSREINILGGEPTTWEYLFEFLKEIRLENEKAKITVTTNGIRFLTDRIYLEEFIEVCKDNNISVNVSWHDDMKIVNILLQLKKNYILKNVIFVPNSVLTLKKTEEAFKKLNSTFHCVWRPFIIADENYKFFSKKITEFLLRQPKKYVQSSLRMVCGKPTDNIVLVGKSNIKKDVYKNLECHCGSNGVLFVDGNLYFCLSQAINKKKSRSIFSTKGHKEWIVCEHQFCCCDTFELRPFVSKKGIKEK